MLDGNIAKLNVVKNREIASEIIYCETRKRTQPHYISSLPSIKVMILQSVDRQISKAGYGKPRGGIHDMTWDLLVRRRWCFYQTRLQHQWRGSIRTHPSCKHLEDKSQHFKRKVTYRKNGMSKIETFNWMRTCFL